jgi:hypothetical protein
MWPSARRLATPVRCDGRFRAPSSPCEAAASSRSWASVNSTEYSIRLRRRLARHHMSTETAAARRRCADRRHDGRIGRGHWSTHAQEGILITLMRPFYLTHRQLRPPFVNCLCMCTRSQISIAVLCGGGDAVAGGDGSGITGDANVRVSYQEGHRLVPPLAPVDQQAFPTVSCKSG